MLISILQKALADRFEAVGIPRDRAIVRNTDRRDIADFQCNSAFESARVMGKSPIEIAHLVVDDYQSNLMTLSVSGKGFINIVVSADLIVAMLAPIQQRELTETSGYPNPSMAIVDFGGPNIAKPMHVGHMRSLFIGDSISRLYEFMGYQVVKDIHLGDWGFQMGLLLAATQDFDHAPTLEELEIIYPAASGKAKSDPEFKLLAQELTCALQLGEDAPEGIRNRWRDFVDLTTVAVKKDLAHLGIEFDVWNGESDSNSEIQNTKKWLIMCNMVSSSEGAIVVEIEDMPPLILQNSQGGYLYGATDLATIMAFRQSAQRVVYVVDERQALHFKQVFEVARRSNMTRGDLHHVGFGTVNGIDGKPLKTRDGGVPKLSDLIAEVQKMAKGRNSDPDISESVAIAALKYGDLQNKRTTNYIYDPERFIKIEGKTGPYICYQAVRIKSILTKAREKGWAATHNNFAIDTPLSHEIAMLIIAFDSVADDAFAEHAPHHLAEYAYRLAATFSRFYDEAMILENDSRLELAVLALERLTASLGLLGITIPERM